MMTTHYPVLGDKVIALTSIDEVLERERAQGHTIALCHGVFDLLHPGHFRHLKAARELADVLVVTITADRFVGKGPGRPVFSEDLRAEALAGLSAVDYVVIVNEATATPAIAAVRPDVYVKGHEYANESDDHTGNIRRERALVERHGGHVAFTDDIVFSSSSLINAFLPQQPPATQEWLTDLSTRHDTSEIFAWLDRLSGIKVTVTGETILDIYTNCETLGKASKEPVLCLNRGESIAQAGGVLAIAAHCAGLGARVTLVTGVNSEDADREQVSSVRAMGVDLRLVFLDPRPTVRKERLIDNQTQARVLEIYEMDDSPLSPEVEESLVRNLEEAMAASEVTLVADYGHGLLTDRVVERICATAGFLAVNAQTNAGNHGFNSISRYHRADFATLNGNEARLEVRRRHLDFNDYMPNLRATLGAQGLLVTQGAFGVDIYLDDGAIQHAPALAPFVKDRVGAGDAVLSATALLVAVGAPPAVVAFVGNMVGAWAVSFLGNERTLDVGELKRQISATLK